jgi:hypothetical protein
MRSGSVQIAPAIAVQLNRKLKNWNWERAITD